MKKSLIITAMLLNVLALGYSQSVLSGTYRYSANAYITFTGSAFTGTWNSTTPISGTYTISGSRLTLSITGGPKSPNTWVWTIVDANSLRDQGGDSWGLVSVKPQSVPAAGTASVQSFNSAEALKEYLDRQPANSRDKPIRVTVSASNQMIKNIAETIRSAGKFVSISINGNALTSIEEYAFWNCTNLTSVTIPNSVTSIGRMAFYGCASLASVTIPNSVISIGENAFGCCSNLTSVTIPNSIRNISDNAFFYCTSLASVTIPNSVASIGDFAFYGCASLASVTIPNSVTSIGDAAFYGCTSLTSVTIPNNVASIGDAAFYGCASLAAINVDAANTKCSSSDGVLYNKNKIELIAYPVGKTGAFIIPTSVTSIRGNVFAGCTGLTALNIAAGNTTYTTEDGVLYNKNKTILIAYPAGKGGSFTIPNSVTSIGSVAFRGCASLKNVTIGNGVTSIGDAAFMEFTSLESVTIPNSVASIGEMTFYGCTNLGSVTMPDSVTNIGELAFCGCTSLASITIPSSVTSIGSIAFSGCTSLASVTFQGTIVSSKFETSAFGGSRYRGVYIGDLRDKYLAGGVGTYTRAKGSNTWSKQ